MPRLLQHKAALLEFLLIAILMIKAGILPALYFSQDIMLDLFSAICNL